MSTTAAGFVVFFASAAVLVLEILAGRVLAPYVGVRLETYTGVIGTVLAGISVGTWAGGRLADRADPRRTLGPLLVGGGGVTLLALPIVRLFASAVHGIGPVAIVTLAFGGFFAPAAVLSAIHPTVVKLQLRDLAQTGRVVGRLSALATAGAIFGTFATGFVLVAALPSRAVVMALGAALVALGVIAWVRLARKPSSLAVVLVAGAVVGGGLAAIDTSPCLVESAYYCAAVVSDPARPSGRTLVLDTLRHSYVDLADPAYLEFRYTRILGDLFDVFRPPAAVVTALHVGGGGFTLPRYLAATRPGSDSLVLELDPSIVRIARERLGLETGPHLRVWVGDARLAVRDLRPDTYDIAVGDAFGGLAVPWHLATLEFVRDVSRVLKPGGVYALNLIDYPPLGFARAEVATLREAFPHVVVVARPSQVQGAEGGNFVLLASEVPIDTVALRDRNRARGGTEEIVASDEDLTRFAAGSRVLTDDFAPVDQLLTVPD